MKNRNAVALLIFCTLVAASALAQTPSLVKGASAAVSNLDLSQNAALIEVRNTSNKDITAYTVSVVAVYANGQKAKSELMKDYGPILTAAGKALHPGETSMQSSSWREVATTSLVTVNVKVTSVIFADRTEENVDPESLGRVVEHRSAVAFMSRKSAEALENALRDERSEHPGTNAAAAMSAIPAASLPPGIGRAYVHGLADDFEEASKHASRLGISEREFLRQRLSELKRRADDEAQYAQIGGKP